jgi:hypothetical protein
MFHSIPVRMIRVILIVYKISFECTASITTDVDRKLLFWKARVMFLFAVLWFSTVNFEDILI